MRLIGLLCGLLTVEYCISAAIDLGSRLGIVEALLHKVITDDIAVIKEKLTKIEAENKTPDVECCDKKDQFGMDQKREDKIKELYDEINEKTKIVMKAFSREKEALKIQENYVSETLDIFGYAVDELKNRTNDLNDRTHAQQVIFDQFAETTNQDLTEKQQNIELIMSSLQKFMTDYTDDKKRFQEERTKLFDELRKERNDAIADLVRDIASLNSSNGEKESEIETRKEEIRCKDGWERQLNSCILYVRDKTLIWDNAQDHCHDLGGALVEPSSSEAMQLLIEGLPVKKKRWWIGATDSREEGVWRWESTRMKIGRVPWGEGEPNNDGGSEDCMELIADSLMNDAPCDGLQSNFMCEIRH